MSSSAGTVEPTIGIARARRLIGLLTRRRDHRLNRLRRMARVLRLGSHRTGYWAEERHGGCGRENCFDLFVHDVNLSYPATI
jgi:hypothetical protein